MYRPHKTFIFYFSLIITGFVAGCSNQPVNRPQFLGSKPVLSDMSNQSLNCSPSEILQNTANPPALYDALTKCVQNNNLTDAAFLFAIAGSNSFYDQLRVNDNRSRQLHSLLPQMTIASFDPQKRQNFQKALQENLGNPSQLSIICKKLEALGPPQYIPTYMINYSRSAVFEGKADSKILLEIDGPSSWKKALGTYLHCPSN